MSRTDQTPPQELDDLQDRIGSVEPLDFEKDEERDARRRIGDPVPETQVEQEFPDEREREAGLTGASVPDHQPTDDDLSPETLIHEDGARSPREQGSDDEPADQNLRKVSGDKIGGGHGLDEAELASIQPANGMLPEGAEEVLEEDDQVLDEDELQGDAPLDSNRDRSLKPPQKP
jgi:hypothetical protein